MVSDVGQGSATVANVRSAARVPRRGGGGDRFRLFLTENGVRVFAFDIRVTRRTSDVDLKARIFKARRLLQMLDDVSQLSRVALLAVHAPSRSRQAALVALLKRSSIK